jgi:Protein of unknown function (DUF1778)
MRDVLAIRLSQQERRQVAEAAERLGKSLSGFVREAALAASARVTGKDGEGDTGDNGLPFVALEPVGYWVDGELVDGRGHVLGAR